ncbi:MAG TPA: biotin--[acetyl-CoA-carboxylase] ligase [Thermoanaerobaculia bacterium]|nr:biotin--[acetyl-CoA-carboxylase] ligase [Thermoanaerobaculia bacterium]
MDFAAYLEEIVRLAPAGTPENLVVLNRVGSTNLLARAILADYDRECQALPTALLLAFEQTAGRGRLGRTWVSPAGQGVYASRTLSVGRPESLQTLPLLVGVGLCRALDAYLSTPCQLKWPNDVLAGGRKIGGILIETRVRPGDCALAVLGFGVNRSQSAADLPHDRATSLLLETGREVSLPQLTWDLVAAVESELLHLDAAARAVALYKERSVHKPGDRLTCRVGEEVVQGSFAGIDPDGMLLLTVDGRELRLTAGELIEGELTEG